MTKYSPSMPSSPTSHRKVWVFPDDEERYALRVMSDNILVELAKLPDTYRGSSIILPQGETGSNLRVGTVLGYGPGALDDEQVFQPTGVEVGEVVVFHRWNMEHKQGRKLGQFLGGGAALIKARDVLLVLPPGSEGVDIT